VGEQLNEGYRPDEFTIARSETLAVRYREYRTALDASPIGGKFMPYDWSTLPQSLSGAWFIYSGMLDEFASELANIINDLTHHVHRLRAWASILAPLSDQEKQEVTHEFVDILGTVALGLPYAIKSRFAFAAGNLCHQANMAKGMTGWVDDFPDKNLYLNDIEPFGVGWQKFRRFKLRVEPIAGTTFKNKTADFRNAYNHGFSARFVLGITGLVSRERLKSGQVCYGIGGSAPLDLEEVADLLEIERDLCYRAFEAFQELVAEHAAAIKAFEEQHKLAAGALDQNPVGDDR
jgi:hypothetical protein